jgi:hypothetical protein
MIFRKNLPGWERTMRVVLGAILIGYGLVGLPAAPLGYAIAAGGATAILRLLRLLPDVRHGRPQALTSVTRRGVKGSFDGIFVGGAPCSTSLPQIGKARGQGFAK